VSEDNVELAHRAYDAFNRRDLDAFLAFNDPEVEFSARTVQMGGDPYLRGHDGLRKWWGDLFAVFPDYRVEVLEVREVGDYSIVALRARAHGLESDAPVDEALWHVHKMRDGRSTRWQPFRSEAEALEAAGLRD
jgi:ketosteroid isomerase-like protein